MRARQALSKENHENNVQAKTPSYKMRNISVDRDEEHKEIWGSRLIFSLNDLRDKPNVERRYLADNTTFFKTLNKSLTL